MIETLNRFCDVLTAERDVHNELLSLSGEKKEAITQNNVSLIDDIVRAEQKLLARLYDGERKRQDLIEQLAETIGKPSSEIVYQDILALSDQNQAERLRALRTELKKLLSDLADINETNKKLIESRIEYIDFALETMSSEQSPSQIYGGTGQDMNPQTRKTNFIDSKA